MSSRLTYPRSQRAWKKFRDRVAELGGEVLEPRWLGRQVPHRCRCGRGHECRPTPNNALSWGICQTCAGNDSDAAWENFRQRIAELGGEVLETAWLGNNVRHRCRCAAGHECMPRPGHVQQGRGICRICAGRDPAISRKLFYDRVAELGGVVLEPEWLGSKVPHLCRCAAGHECRPRPDSIRAGQGMCQVCANRDPAVARENFYRRIAELGGLVLEQRWLGSQVPHLCRCVAGHECMPAPGNVRQGHSMCRTCAGRDSEAAWENFRKQVAGLGGEVLELGWLGTDIPHHCRCPRGHECRPRPNSIRRGQGMCRACTDWEQDVVYVVRNPATCCVKFGITKNDGRARLGDHRGAGFTQVVCLETGLPESLAAHIELKIKVALEMADAQPVRGREYFSGEHTALILNEINIWIPGDTLTEGAR
jgi:hypothetical protein